MEEVNNYKWVELLPNGWHELARKMIEECEAIYPEWEITDLKEKFGAICCYDCGAPKDVYDIIEKYENLSARTCCKCGKPATKYSTGWILPWCDDCGTKEYGPYKEFNHDSTATNNN